MESIKVTVNSDFKPYINRACVRLNYLYPEVSFKEGKEDISYSLLENTEIDKKELETNIYHQLYRERIYDETKSIRTWLYSDS
jgi:hypothetical protein